MAFTEEKTFYLVMIFREYSSKKYGYSVCQYLYLFAHSMRTYLLIFRFVHWVSGITIQARLFDVSDM
jgi:hypothetical protein